MSQLGPCGKKRKLLQYKVVLGNCAIPKDVSTMIFLYLPLYEYWLNFGITCKALFEIFEKLPDKERENRLKLRDQIENTIDDPSFLRCCAIKHIDVWFAAVKLNGRVLKYVPKKWFTTEMCIFAVREDGMAIQYVFDNCDLIKKQDLSKICFEAVKEYGAALQHIRRELRTKKLCKAAIRNCGNALQFVPWEFRTAKLCLEAVIVTGHAISYIADKLITPKMCSAAVNQNGCALMNIPKNLRSVDLSLKAVTENGRALNYVLVKHRTPNICSVAVNNYKNAMKWVPKHFKIKYYI